MAIPKLHGTFRQVNPRRQTSVRDQAQRTRNSVPPKKLSSRDYPVCFPGRPLEKLRQIPEEFILITVARDLRRTIIADLVARLTKRSERGSVGLSVLAAIVGGSGGYLAGTAVQFHVLKESIAKEAGLTESDLIFLDYQGQVKRFVYHLSQ